jgi:hypothetical protein
MRNCVGSLNAGAGGTSVSKSSIGGEVAQADAPPLHVITLVSSAAPMPLRAPTAAELAGLAVFRSRQVEDGRERFRLHIGYFQSAEAAESLLPIVRQTYPAAIVAIAPQSNMNSLDDTALARFRILGITEPPVRDVAATAPARSAAAPQAAAARATQIPLAEPPPPQVQAPPVLTRADAVNPPPAPMPKAREAQHYAVQLIWSRDPIDIGTIPTLAIYGGYLLYAVETKPGPQHFYGVRMGFFGDALSARLVAQYIRSDFKGVAVVPVSDREMTRAEEAAIRLAPSRTARVSAGSVARWPAAALAVGPVNLGKAVALAGL